MIWLNLARQFLGNLAANDIEAAEQMLMGFNLGNLLNKYNFSGVAITKTAYNNMDIFIECIVSNEKIVMVFEYDKEVRKIFDIKIYKGE